MELIGEKSPHGPFPVLADFGAVSGKLRTYSDMIAIRTFP
jgi:hypothetical protein